MIDYDSKSWLGVLFRVRGSVGPRLLVRTGITAVLGTIASYLFQNHKFHTPSLAHTMIGVALGLLLVFRTNTSFDRWWEGRKLLGSVVNRTRDLGRQLAGYLPAAEGAAAAEVSRLLNAYFAVAVQGLRGETDLARLGELLTAEERERLEPVKSRPSVVLAWVTGHLDALARRGALSEARLLAMDTNVTALSDAHGACERIARTPIPFAYAQHIKVFVTLWCFTLPFAIVDAMLTYTWLASSILAFALFGIDEIGVEIEDPFGYDDNDLPVDRIVQTVKLSLADLTRAGRSEREPD
jgi:putative membrane protein